jgi:hypothetical protein
LRWISANDEDARSRVLIPALDPNLKGLRLKARALR